jgi:hypothetical protein
MKPSSPLHHVLWILLLFTRIGMQVSNYFARQDYQRLHDQLLRDVQENGKITYELATVIYIKDNRKKFPFIKESDFDKIDSIYNLRKFKIE